MAEPLRRTVAAMPEPRLVVAIGDCAINCGEFAGGSPIAGVLATHPAERSSGRNSSSPQGTSPPNKPRPTPHRPPDPAPPRGCPRPSGAEGGHVQAA
jgi:hypothetical protein